MHEVIEVNLTEAAPKFFHRHQQHLVSSVVGESDKHGDAEKGKTPQRTGDTTKRGGIGDDCIVDRASCFGSLWPDCDATILS